MEPLTAQSASRDAPAILGGGFNGPLDYTVSLAGRTLGLSPAEVCALKLVLVKNYVRSFGTLVQLAVEDHLTTFLHPIAAEHLASAALTLQGVVDDPADTLETVMVYRLARRSPNDPLELAQTLCVPAKRQLPLILLLEALPEFLSSRMSQWYFFNHSGRDVTRIGSYESTTITDLWDEAGIASVFAVPAKAEDSDGLRLLQQWRSFEKLQGVRTTTIPALDIGSAKAMDNGMSIPATMLTNVAM